MPQLTPEQRAKIDQQNLANILKKASAGKVLSARDVEMLDNVVEVKTGEQDAERATGETLIHLSDLARICKTDHRDVSAVMIDDGIDHIDGPRRAKLYPLFKSVAALVSRKGQQTAIEQRNIQDALLKEAQRKKLEREWIPLPEARHLASRMAKQVCESIEASSLSLDEQNLLMTNIKNAMIETLGEEEDE